MKTFFIWEKCGSLGNSSFSVFKEIKFLFEVKEGIEGSITESKFLLKSREN